MSDSKFKIILAVVVVVVVAAVASGIFIGRSLKKEKRQETKDDFAQVLKKHRIVVVQEKVRVVKVKIPACPPTPKKSFYRPLVRPKKYRLRKGREYYIRLVNGSSMGGDYLGARKIKGRTFLVFRARTAHCKGTSGCWNRRNIQLSKIVEITDKHSDEVCEQHWCTD